ncbi:AglZ/HisF2 family acetamidino modification protein [Luminiphilus sp.]|nr:AglZ/HisF2 family acetamidino modification protein [Luminiphilus sp.]
MLKTRVIPCLLLSNGGLVKTVKFSNPKYIGDPINAVRIFNEKEVDELVFLDIDATKNNSSPNFELLGRISSEAFMPFSYGGGIKSLDQVKKLFALGVEKVVINSAAIEDNKLISDIAKMAGSSSTVVSIDVHQNVFGKYIIKSRSGTRKSKLNLIDYVKTAEDSGAGEILLNSINRDGLKNGYDLKTLKLVANTVNIPVVPLGGAGSLIDMRDAVNCGASAVAAGSFFVFHGAHKAVLITYPQYEVMESIFND